MTHEMESPGARDKRNRGENKTGSFVVSEYHNAVDGATCCMGVAQ